MNQLLDTAIPLTNERLIPLVLASFYVFVRVSAAMALLPPFGEQVIPARVKLGAAVAMTLAVAPAAPAAETFHLGTLLCEIGNGFLIGLSFRILVYVLQMAGSFAAQSTSLAQMFSAGGLEPQTTFSSILTLGGIALACSLGLHVKFAALFIESYDLLPVGQLPAPDLISAWATYHISRSYTLAIGLAAPFVLASLLYNITLGAINRAMPTLMVTLVGAPAITYGALVLLAISAPLILSLWINTFNGLLLSPFSMAR